MGQVAEVFNEQTLQAPSRPHRDRPHALFDRRREHARERAAVPDRLRTARSPSCHNGNLVNALELRDGSAHGSIFQTTSDTEVLLHLYAREAATIDHRSVESLAQVRGAFSLALLTKDRLIAARDPHGLPAAGAGPARRRPSSLRDVRARPDRRRVRPRRRAGRAARDQRRRPVRSSPSRRSRSRTVCSSTSTSPGPTATSSAAASTRSAPTSAAFWRARRPSPPTSSCRSPTRACAPRSATRRRPACRCRWALIRNHYVGRTFIQPQQSIRHFSVRVKLNPVRSILEGKRVILLDDSIVRGTTSRKIVKMVKAAGAREVHLRISCPPTVSPCFYGVDTPSRSELIAATHTRRGDQEITSRPTASPT